MRRGEIYFVDFDPVQGREQSGVRPALVVSGSWVNTRPLVVVVVPGTDGVNVLRDYPTNVRIPADETGLPHETVFMCFQARALDPSRLPQQPSGQLGASRMQEIDKAFRYTFEV